MSLCVYTPVRIWNYICQRLLRFQGRTAARVSRYHRKCVVFDNLQSNPNPGSLQLLANMFVFVPLHLRNWHAKFVW